MTDDATALYFQDLRAALIALGPIGDRIVVVGGVVPLFYRHHPDFVMPRLPPDRTRDIDIAVPRDLPADHGRLDDLLVAAGFVVVHNRATNPAVTLFQPARYGDVDRGESYIEILTPAVGRPEPVTERLKLHGVVAQRLRYMDLALDHAITMDASRLPELRLDRPLLVRIPHPVSFVVHKLLVMSYRGVGKFDRDAAYLYDVACATVPAWASFTSELAKLGRPGSTRAKWIAKAGADARRWFGSEHGDGSLGASRVLRSIHPEGPTQVEVAGMVGALLDAIGLPRGQEERGRAR